MRRYKIRERILDRVLKPIWKQVKNASRNVLRKKGSNSTEKRRCRVKYTKNKTEVPNMAATEFITKENSSHYVNIRKNG